METFSLAPPIDWNDTDALGHINNLAILRYAQSARVVVSQEMGLVADGRTIGPILASIQCRFFQPLYYPGTVTIRSRILSVRTTSFVLENEILSEDGQLAARTKDVVVCYDYQARTKLPLPQPVKTRILQVLAPPFEEEEAAQA